MQVSFESFVCRAAIECLCHLNINSIIGMSKRSSSGVVEYILGNQVETTNHLNIYIDPMGHNQLSLKINLFR
jgi:hypothetical protein